MQPRSGFSRHLIASGTHPRATAPARGLGAVLAEVAEPDGFLSRWFRTVVLEYDLAASRAPEAEAPGVFLEPHGSFLDPSANPTPSARGRGVTCGPRIMTSAVCRAVGRETDPAECGAMERVHRARPRTATTEHLGALPGREPRAVRLVVAMPKTAVAPPIESLDADAVVNANALAYLGPTASTRRARDWLVSLVETGGEREAIHYYWDPVDLYAAMAQAGRLQATLFDDVRPLLATRIRDRRVGDGSYGDVLRTAIALLSLDALGCPPARDDLAATVHLLLMRRQADGGWPACPLSSGPLWPDERRFAFVSRCYDTACCVAALHRASAALDPR